MPTIHARTTTPINKAQPYPPNVGNVAELARTAKRTVAPAAATALEAIATALTNLQSASNSAHAALRKPVELEQLLITDSSGKVIGAIGDFEYNGVVTANYFSEIHVGDPLNTGNPALALFNAKDNHVTIGQNGIVEVLDPFGGVAAWLGTQADMLPVTGAVNNGAGLIRLTVVAHTLATGDSVAVANVGGVPNATGIRTVTMVDANHVDLQATVFIGPYTSGGTVNRLMHITGAVAAAGLIRLTVAGHTYETGDEVNVVGVGGVPNATGQWIITVVTANTFDLRGSTFAGAYSGGGTCLRYFAGMLAQTIAIGPSFPDYRLRAFADGSLRIKDATFSLTSGDITISISEEPVSGFVFPGIQVKNNVTGYGTAMMDTGFVVLDPSGNALSYMYSVGGCGHVIVEDASTDHSVNLDGQTGLVIVRSVSDVAVLHATYLEFNSVNVIDGTTGAHVVAVESSGDITTTGGIYRHGAAPGISATRNMVASVTTASNIVFGTPGIGQSNGTAVVGVSLTSTTFSGGIITT